MGANEFRNDGVAASVGGVLFIHLLIEFPLST